MGSVSRCPGESVRPRSVDGRHFNLVVSEGVMINQPCPRTRIRCSLQLPVPGSRLGSSVILLLLGVALMVGISMPVRAADGARAPRIGARPLSPAPMAACLDSDGDGYPACVGGCDTGGKACDCDDSKASVHPGATEICNGVDDNCNGQVDELVDPDPIDGTDNNGNTLVDEGFGFCLYQQDGPTGQCKTAGRQECHNPPDPAHTVINPVYGTMTCVLPPGKPITLYSDESIAAGNCNDGSDNNCNGLTDIHDPGCQAPEVCDGLDNDGDGIVDNGFHIGQPCTVGVGACQRTGVLLCDGLQATKCSALPGAK